MFGRFALHKEAFANGSVEFSEQAKLLLHWTTAKVIPALSRLADPRSPAVPFIDPNLSSICVEKSFDTFTSSPEPVGRPRRRVNRNRTPERLDEGLGIFDHSPDAMQSTLRVGVGAAVSLLNSSCVLFSEWLAVGGAGASFVAQAAADWCRIFENSATKDEMHNELAPAFWRLTMQLAKTANDYSLMKQLLIKFHDGMTGEDEASLVRTALASLLATRGNQSDEIAIGLVNCVIDAASEILENETSPLKFELPMSLGTLSDSENGCIISALCAILGNQSASLELARQLVERFSAHAQESTRIALFDAKILWVLCNFEGGSKIVAEASEMVRQLNSEGVENELGKFVEELMDACKPV